MPVSDAELSTLAASYDIITLGVKADEVRRARHGTRTTFVRVADVACEPGTAVEVPAAAGEVRIVGTPESRAAALQRVREVAPASRHAPLSGFSLAELEHLADELPEKERAAVVLRYGYDLPYDQIADALDSSEDAARQAASSGVRRLRRRLA